MFFRCVVVFFTISFYESGVATSEKYWQGNWFPADPGSEDINVETVISEKSDLRDDKHGVKMGIPDPDCDDARTNLTTDWDDSPLDYTCLQRRFMSNYNVYPEKKCDKIPTNYHAYHLCMNVTINYYHTIPTFGNHRPLWAAYGEYTYVPKQRWLHNLEHGAVVMLYHPCADPVQVTKLKIILRNCMWKHVISAFKDLTEEQPIVLVAWGCRLFMNVVDNDIVTNFIQNHGMKGPEIMYSQGFYTKGMFRLAELISDKNDTYLCPNNL